MKSKLIIKILLLVIVAALSIGMVACNNDGYVDVIDLPEDYDLSPQGKIKVSTYLRTGADSEMVLDKWIRSYNDRYPNVVVKPEIIAWGDFPTKIAAGDIGDVYYTAECDVYNYAIKGKAAMPLDAYIDLMKIDITQIYTGLYDLGCYNGYLYMCPSDLSQNVLYTNVTALEESGLSRPPIDWSWETFREYCQRLQRVEADGTYSQVGLLWGQEFGNCHIFLSGWGGKWCDTVNKKVYLYSDSKVLEGYSEMMDLIAKGYMCVSGLKGEIGAKYANVTKPTGFVFTLGTYINRVQLFEQYKEMGVRLDVTSYPCTPVVRVINGGATGFMAYSKTKNPDAAATFALMLLTDEGQEAYNDSLGGGIPITKHNIEKGNWRIPYADKDFNYDAFVCFPEAFCASWATCFVPPEIAKILETHLNDIATKYFANEMDYRDCLSAAEKAVNEKWATLYGES